MNIEKIIEVMKMKSINIPLYLVKKNRDLKLDIDELLVISILMDNRSIDYINIGNYLNMDNQDVLLTINKLQEKGLLEIKVIKNIDGIMEEQIDLNNLYRILAQDIIGIEKESSTNIYTVFEKEFGRTLSSMEYEIISNWLSLYNEDIVIEALKEAVYNGVSNLKYIDRILHEWHKKGFKNINDVRKDKEKFNKNKKEKIEIPDYNWLEDNE